MYHKFQQLLKLVIHLRRPKDAQPGGPGAAPPGRLPHMLPPKMVIAGGNGFLGQHLARHFRQRGYRVVVVGRGSGAGPDYLRWDGRTLGPWAAALEGAAALVNLAGRTVDCRYTAANKRAVRASRTESTRVLGEAVAACAAPPKVWLNSSTATIYADTSGEQPANTEAAGRIGEGFSVEVARAFKAATRPCGRP